jgi:transposase InsO family protein
MTPWHWTESDLIGPLPKSKGKDAIYVVVDQFTKYTYFVPCNTMETAQTLAQLHAKYVWAHEGLLQIHSMDRGPQFKAEYTKELYQHLGIEQRLSTAYHPQSQGQVENLNRWLETYSECSSAINRMTG